MTSSNHRRGQRTSLRLTFIFILTAIQVSPLAYATRLLPFSVRWTLFLFEVPLKTCLVYIDVVVIFSKNNLQHIEDIDKVLRILHQAAVTLIPPKFNFFQEK